MATVVTGEAPSVVDRAPVVTGEAPAVVDRAPAVAGGTAAVVDVAPVVAGKATPAGTGGAPVAGLNDLPEIDLNYPGTQPASPRYRRKSHGSRGLITHSA